jgi:hypothetical protein
MNPAKQKSPITKTVNVFYVIVTEIFVIYELHVFPALYKCLFIIISVACLLLTANKLK